MKVCKYCDTKTADETAVCESCGAKEFSYVCSNCGNVFSNGDFCPKCGVKYGKQAKICPKCGTSYYSYACPDCGYTPNRETTVIREQPQYYNTYNTVTRSAPATTAGNAKDKWVAFFLCLFLGYLGAHKFYEGKIGMGILYICTGGLFLVGWGIDALILLLKPNPYYVK